MSRRTLKALAIGGLLLATAGWYWFRPERLFIDRTVAEPFLERENARPVAAGRFHGVTHETAGSATVYRLNSGKLALRLEDFHTSNGPDVVVYLVAAPDAQDAAAVKGGSPILLGELKGNVGDQTYQLPDDTDLGKYRSVTIWCRRFSVNFGTAPLH